MFTSPEYFGAEYTIHDILEGQAALELKFDMSKLEAKDYHEGTCLVEIAFSKDFVRNFQVLPKISLKIAAVTTGDKIYRQTIALRNGPRTKADWPDLRKSLPFVYWRPVDDQNMLIPGTEGAFRVYPEATKTTTVKDYRHPLLHWRDESVPHQGVALSHIRQGVVMSQHVQAAYGFAKRAFVIEPAKVVIEIKGVETYTIPIQDTKQLDDFATNLNNLAIPEPYILKATQKGRTITIKHPPAGVKIRLSHVLGNYYDFATTKEAERWTATILYYDDVSMGQVEKIYTIDAKKSWPAQVSELKIATTRQLTALGRGFTMKLSKAQNQITSVDINDNFEIRLSAGLAKMLKTRHRLRASNVNSFEWIVGDLAGESLIGSASLPLLTPTPLMIGTSTVTGKEYVPVQKHKFSEISLKLVTNLAIMELFDGPYELLVMLHFQPRHKRSRGGDGGSCTKRLCMDGYCERTLQQTDGARGDGMGIRQLGGGPFDTLRKYAIPILHRLREKFGGVGKNIAETVKEASSATLRKIAQEIPSVAAEGVKKVLERGTEKFINKTIGKKRAASPPPTPSKRHKRSRIDEVLGDDSY